MKYEITVHIDKTTGEVNTTYPENAVAIETAQVIKSIADVIMQQSYLALVERDPKITKAKLSKLIRTFTFKELQEYLTAKLAQDALPVKPKAKRRSRITKKDK